MNKTSKICKTIAVLLFNFTFIHGGTEKVVLVSPVLAATAHSGAKVAETAKDFPVLTILAGEPNGIAHIPPQTEANHQPIYVQKLEDQPFIKGRKIFKYLEDKVKPGTKVQSTGISKRLPEIAIARSLTSMITLFDMWFNKLIITLLLTDITLFTIVTSFFIGDELIMAPLNIPEINYKQNLAHQRIRRQVFGINRRFYHPAAIQPRDQTVIVVPDRTSTQYRRVPSSPYGVNSLPNSGTTVVVSQVPDYNYNNIARSYDVLPINTVTI